MENKKIKIIESILSKILGGLFYLMLTFIVLRIHGFTVDKEYVLYAHKYVAMDMLIIVGALYLVIKYIFLLYDGFSDSFNKLSLKKHQKLQLEKIEDKIIFDEGMYEVFVEIQKHKQYSTSMISLKTRIKESETLKGFLQTLYNHPDCNYIVINIVSLQKIADLNEIQLPNTLNNIVKNKVKKERKTK